MRPGFAGAGRLGPMAEENADLFQLTGRFAGRQALTVLLCLHLGHFHGAGIIGREGIAALAGIFLFA